MRCKHSHEFKYNQMKDLNYLFTINIFIQSLALYIILINNISNLLGYRTCENLDNQNYSRNH